MNFRFANKKQSMHTEENTDIDIIKKNCKSRQLENADNNCVLIITGSLNPIHSSHIKNLELVREYLEKHKTRPLNVLAAYLSPTHDSYVHDKLGDTDWISGEDRCKLCKLAIDEEKLTDFISVAKGEVQSTSGFVDFPEVTITLAEFLNEKLYGTDKLLHHSLKVVYVCGLDHFNKCPSVAWLAKKENIACAVIYRRGAPDARIKKLEEESSNIYYITLEAERDTLVDISSTAIRERYRNPNAEDSNDLTYSFVHDFLQKKYCEK